MQNKIISPLKMLAAGLTVLSISIFAEVIGLDKNPGDWGKTRIAIFVFGISISICAALYYLFWDKVNRVVENFKSFLENCPATSWVWKNKNLLNLFKYFRKYSFTFPILIFILTGYIWLVSSGTWTQWVSPSRYYASLAQGFQYGTLYLPTKPDPRLAELANPYDPVNWRGTINVPMDISYYKGRFYLYWGPTPAFLLYLFRPFYYGRIGDLYLVFVFVSGIFISQFLFITMVWDRFFSDFPRWTLQFPLLLVGLACPLTFMLGNFKGARYYEAAISSGQFFLLAGFLVAYTALSNKFSIWKLALTGVFWAFAFGSRLTLIFPVGFMALMIAYWLYKIDNRPVELAKKIIFLVLPIAIGLVSLGWYNWARFGSITESGLYYQLTAGLYLQKYNKDLIDPIYFLQNLYNYIAYPFAINAQFPYISPQYTYTVPVLDFYPLPQLYNGQWMTGFIWTIPFVIFSIIPFIGVLKNSKNKVIQQSTDQDQLLLNWIVVTLAGSFLLAFGFLLVFFWAAIRYQEDFVPSLIMLSIIGFWVGYRYFTQKPFGRIVYALFAVIAVAVSIVNSTLLAISVNDARINLINALSLLR